MTQLGVDSTCKMQTWGIDLRYYFSEAKTTFAVSGGINFNSFDPYTNNFGVESDGVGFNLSLIFLTQIYNFIGGGLEIGYSRYPFKVKQYSNTNSDDFGTENFGGFFINGIFNFALLNY